MQTVYKTKGTCATQIVLDIENGIIQSVRFQSGCNGNLQGIGRLAEGMDAREVAKRLAGVQCGPRGTSCPDQLAKAIKEALGE